MAALSDNSIERLVLDGAHHYALGGMPLAVPPNRSVTIEGNDAAVDGERLSGLFHVGRNATLELRRIDLQNAYGSAVHVDSGAAVTIANAVVSGCHGRLGGVVHLDNAALRMEGVSVFDSSATLYGGVIYAHSATVTIESLTAVNTFANAGGGVLCALSSSVVTIDTLTATNTFADDGAVVYAFDSPTGGPPPTSTATVKGPSTITIETLTATNTSANGNGGVIAVSTSTLIIDRLTATYTSAKNRGGVLCAESASVVTIDSLTATCASAHSGGAVAASESVVTIDSLTATSNSAYAYGGVLYVVSSSTLTIESLAATDTSANYRGGVVLVSSSTVTIESLTSTNTSARDGGVLSASISTLTIERLTANSASANWRGGALYVYSSKVMLGTRRRFVSSMRSSSAPTGAAIWLNGDAELEATSLRIEHDCTAATTAIVYREPGALVDFLPIRDLQIGLLGCDGSGLAALSGFESTSFPACDDRKFTNTNAVEEDICASREGTACTDAPIAPWSTLNLTTPRCACAPGYLPNRGAHDQLFAPYSSLVSEGCVRPINLEGLSRISSIEVVVPLIKDPAQPEKAADEVELTMSLNGSDWHTDDVHTWSVPPPTVPWLRLEHPRGNISSPRVTVPLLVDAKGRPDGYDATYDVVVTAALSQRGVLTRQLVSLPVRIVVTALVALEECTLDSPSWRPTIGKQATFLFTARDVDGLPLQATGFTTVLTIDGEDFYGEDVTRNVPLVTMQYMGAVFSAANLPSGEYSVQLTPRILGAYTLRVLHNGRHMPHASQSFAPTCPTNQAPLIDGTCSCEAGSTPSEDGGCSLCPAGTYKSTVGRLPCTPCPTNQLTDVKGASSPAACVCKVDYFLLPSADPPCQSCTSSMVCAVPNVTLRTLPLAPGYWRLSDQSLESIRCDPPGAAADSACLGGLVGSDLTCAAGHKGPLCRVCEQSEHYFHQETRRCEACSRSSASWGIGVTVAVLALSAAALVAAIRWAPLTLVKEAAGHLVAVLKLVVGFYQVVQVVPTVYGVALPDEFAGVQRVIDLFSFDWLSIPTACVGSFLTRLWLQATLPIVVVGIVIVASVGLAVVRGAGTRHGLLRALPFALAAAFALVPGVSRAIFASFDCEAFMRDAAAHEYEYYLRSDYAVHCDGHLYGQIKGSAILLIVVWPIGVLAAFAVLLYACRRTTGAALGKSIRFLTHEYRDDLFYWELVEVARRLFLTGFMLLIQARGVVWRLVIAILVCFVHFALLLSLKPYQREKTTVLAMGFSASLFVIFLSALFLRIIEQQPAELQLVLFGTSSVLGLTTVMVASTMAMLVLLLLQLPYERAQRMKRARQRDQFAWLDRNVDILLPKLIHLAEVHHRNSGIKGNLVARLQDPELEVRNAAVAMLSTLEIDPPMLMDELPPFAVAKVLQHRDDAVRLDGTRCAIERNDWMLVRLLCDTLDNPSQAIEVRKQLEHHASEQRRLIMEASNTTVVVLSTRFDLPQKRVDGTPVEQDGLLTPLYVSDLVKAHTEAIGKGRIKCFNPNRDNVAMEGGDTDKANGIWLLTWRKALMRAKETGGCVLRLDYEDAGLSSMQQAETDMAADQGVCVSSLVINASTTEQCLKAQLQVDDGCSLRVVEAPARLVASNATPSASSPLAGNKSGSRKQESEMCIASAETVHPWHSQIVSNEHAAEGDTRASITPEMVRTIPSRLLSLLPFYRGRRLPRELLPDPALLASQMKKDGQPLYDGHSPDRCLSRERSLGSLNRFSVASLQIERGEGTGAVNYAGYV